MMHDGDRWNQGFRSMHVHDAGFERETISEGGRNGTHEVMNFCASWYPAAATAAAAAVVAAVAVDDSSSPLASESESSTTARKPNPIGRSKPESSRALFFVARPFEDDEDEDEGFDTLGALEEGKEEEVVEVGRPSCAAARATLDGGGGGGRGGRGRGCRSDSEEHASRTGGVGATMAADELADDDDDDDDDGDDDARAV